MFETIDIFLLKQINFYRNTSFDSLFIFITDTGPVIAALIPLLIICGGILYSEKEWRVIGYKIAIPYLLSVVTSNTLKYIVNRPRPFITYPFVTKLSGAGSGSFPSGHTSDAFSIAMIVSLLFPKPLIVIPMFVWAILVGYSRIDLGVHYPSDVLAGATVGIGSAWGCFRYFRGKQAEKNIPNENVNVFL